MWLAEKHRDREGAGLGTDQYSMPNWLYSAVAVACCLSVAVTSAEDICSRQAGTSEPRDPPPAHAYAQCCYLVLQAIQPAALNLKSDVRLFYSPSCCEMTTQRRSAPSSHAACPQISSHLWPSLLPVYPQEQHYYYYQHLQTSPKSTTRCMGGWCRPRSKAPGE